MAGRLPDAPFAFELVQLVPVGLCRQLSGGNYDEAFKLKEGSVKAIHLNLKEPTLQLEKFVCMQAC